MLTTLRSSSIILSKSDFPLPWIGCCGAAAAFSGACPTPCSLCSLSPPPSSEMARPLPLLAVVLRGRLSRDRRLRLAPAEAPPAADIQSSDAAPAAEKAPEAEKPLDIQSSGRRRRLRGGA